MRIVNPKRVFSSILLFFVFPFRWLKRSKVDNFVGGLIFGAIFSLVVNIVTVHIQEVITRQRVLEAIEHEIVINTIRATTKLEANSRLLDGNQRVNFFYIPETYSDNLWRQSSEAIQYISQLDAEVQTEVMLYYTYGVTGANMFVTKADEFNREQMSGCHEGLEFLYEPRSKEVCDFWNRQIIQTEITAAQNIAERGFDTLKVFHPTQDRLNNLFLRLLMGSESVTILSGKESLSNQ